jgi:glycosyltransferase involved in cell wall biosynthesis
VTGTTDVTVVIPTRNRADLLRTTLRSVQVAVDEARRAGWSTRVLVVDDCSDDDSTAVAAREEGADVVRLEVHDGQNDPASAIVRGVAEATSTYITLFGDDDIMLPRYLVAHLEKLAEGYDLCSGSFLRADGALVVQQEVILPEPRLGDLLAGSITVNDGAMVRRELFQAGPWDSTRRQQVIYPVWLTILSSDARTTRLTEPTWIYRRHGGNISMTLDETDARLREAVLEPFLRGFEERGEPLPPSTKALVQAETEAYAEAEVRARDEQERRRREEWESLSWLARNRRRAGRRVRRARTRLAAWIAP